MAILVLNLLIGVFAQADVDFSSLKSEQKEAIQLNSKNRKLIYFWASWCPDCKDKIGNYLPKIHQQKDVDLVLVNTDKNRDRALHFIKKNNVALPNFFDEEKSFRKQFKVFGVPHWAVVKFQDGKWTKVESEAGSNIEKLSAALKK